MRALVTGAAGFVGSHLAQRLLGDGWDVVGVDCLTPYYDTAQKRSNLGAVQATPGLVYRDDDLRTADVRALLGDVDVVFHQAGQPGVRASWNAFQSYVEHNVLVTQRLLEAARDTGVSRFVYASSSSVYGDAVAYPTDETMLPGPRSPYGVTKLAGEHLCTLYASNWGVPTVSLRYFTVFGPRQRPDMAMHRLIEAALTGSSFPLYGTGDQVRDFTYVDDVVRANVAAALSDVEPGTVMNTAGGSGTMTMNEVIGLVETLTGRPVLLDRRAPQAGDVERTGGDISRAQALLGWRPEVPVGEGLARQVQWHLDRASAPAALAMRG